MFTSDAKLREQCQRYRPHTFSDRWPRDYPKYTLADFGSLIQIWLSTPPPAAPPSPFVSTLSSAVKRDNAAAGRGSTEVPMHMRYDHGRIPG